MKSILMLSLVSLLALNSFAIGGKHKKQKCCGNCSNKCEQKCPDHCTRTCSGTTVAFKK